MPDAAGFAINQPKKATLRRLRSPEKKIPFLCFFCTLGILSPILIVLYLHNAIEQTIASRNSGCD
jgi:hypothetical protein